MSRGIAIRRHVVVGGQMKSAEPIGTRRARGVVTAPQDALGRIQAESEVGADVRQAAEGIVIGAVRGARRVGAAHLLAIGRASETVIKTTARISGDLGVATRGLIEGAIHGAREFGFDVVDAATAAAAGAMKAAAQIGVEAGLQVRSALVTTISNLKVVLNEPFEAFEPSEDPGREPA